MAEAEGQIAPQQDPLAQIVPAAHPDPVANGGQQVDPLVIGPGPNQVSATSGLVGLRRLIHFVKISRRYALTLIKGQPAQDSAPRLVYENGMILTQPETFSRFLSQGDGVKDFEIIVVLMIAPFCPLTDTFHSIEELRTRVTTLTRDAVKTMWATALSKGHTNEKTLKETFEYGLVPILKAFAPQIAAKETHAPVKLEAKYQTNLSNVIHIASISDVGCKYLSNEGLAPRTLPALVKEYSIHIVLNPAVVLAHFIYNNTEFCNLTAADWSTFFNEMFMKLSVPATGYARGMLEARFMGHIKYLKLLAPNLSAQRLSDEKLEEIFYCHHVVWQQLVISSRVALYQSARIEKDPAQTTIDVDCIFTSWMKRHSFMSEYLKKECMQKPFGGANPKSFGSFGSQSRARQQSYASDNTVSSHEETEVNLTPMSRKTPRSASASPSVLGNNKKPFTPTKRRW